MSISRNQKNYIIMSIIYMALTDASVHKDGPFRSFEELINDEAISSIISAEEDEMIEARADQYICNSVNLALSNYVEIVNLVKPHLKKWTWERLPLLSQSIILMSVSHFNYVEKVDKRIVIDVAVTLAKKYIEPKDARFINGLLDEVLN